MGHTVRWNTGPNAEADVIRLVYGLRYGIITSSHGWSSDDLLGQNAIASDFCWAKMITGICMLEIL